MEGGQELEPHRDPPSSPTSSSGPARGRDLRRAPSNILDNSYPLGAVNINGDLPVILAARGGHELIDVDGRRYLDAISSLWVTTLGHRVPELDAAVREQLERVAHSTMLGNGNRVVIELAEALAAVVPVDARTSCSRPTAPRPSSRR